MTKEEFYKERIVEMLKEVENIKYLEFLYEMILSFKNKWSV